MGSVPFDMGGCILLRPFDTKMSNGTSNGIIVEWVRERCVARCPAISYYNMAGSVLFCMLQLHMGGPGAFFEWRCIRGLLCFFLSGTGPDRRLNVLVRGPAEIECSDMGRKRKSSTQL